MVYTRRLYYKGKLLIIDSNTEGLYLVYKYNKVSNYE